MKLLMLGGSKAQLPGILKAQEMGHYVITCDYLESSIGHKISDESYLTSTFDSDGVYEIGQKCKIDGIMTMGTDQPVYTIGTVAEKLNLPMMISKETSLAVTNKKVMKEVFVKKGIPTVKYCLYKPGEEKALDMLTPPYVIKPLDSQGQRGIYYLETIEEVVNHYDSVIKYSRKDEILVEEFYEHEEITVSGWVVDGQTTVLSITDRVTFEDRGHIGICLSHEFPSKQKSAYQEKLIQLSKKIVKAFNITDGPIYFQFLVGKDGIKVNEIACRIGGAFEATFIPKITGFDICKANINASLGKTIDINPLKGYQIANNSYHVSVQLFFMSPCRIAYVTPVEDVEKIEGVLEVGIYVKKDDNIPKIQNATSRAGYVVVLASSHDKLTEKLEEIYSKLRIEDQYGNNHIIHRKGIKN